MFRERRLALGDRTNASPERVISRSGFARLLEELDPDPGPLFVARRKIEHNLAALLVRLIGRCSTGLGKVAASERCRAIRDRVGSAAISVLPALVLAALFGAGVSDSSADNADKLQVRFEIYGFAGFHVLTNRTTVEESANRYSIAMDLDTRGLARIFVDLTSHSEVHGRLDRDTARPESYRAEVRRNSVERFYAVDYRSDGAVINASTPPSSGPSFSIPAERIRSTVDQLTAYFLLERQLARRGKCALVVPVFDGSALYNIRFTDIDPEILSADIHQSFAGLTQPCEVTREDILLGAGPGEDTYRRGRIWYARFAAGDLMLPVRMEFDTAFGPVRGYLAELHQRGADIHLMRD
jgi:Protein of unknown function (DUF3108)